MRPPTGHIRDAVHTLTVADPVACMQNVPTACGLRSRRASCECACTCSATRAAKLPPFSTRTASSCTLARGWPTHVWRQRARRCTATPRPRGLSCTSIHQTAIALLRYPETAKLGSLAEIVGIELVRPGERARLQEQFRALKASPIVKVEQSEAAASSGRKRSAGHGVKARRKRQA